MEEIRKKFSQLVKEGTNLIKAGGELTPKELATWRINRRKRTIEELTRYLEAWREPITKEEATKYLAKWEELEKQRKRKVKEWQEYREELKQWNKKEIETYKIKKPKN